MIAVHHDGKLIAADSVRIALDGAETASHDREQLVTGQVAAALVERLQPVDIEEYEAGAAAALLRLEAAHAFVEGAPVSESGEHITVCHSRHEAVRPQPEVSTAAREHHGFESEGQRKA